MGRGFKRRNKNKEKGASENGEARPAKQTKQSGGGGGWGDGGGKSYVSSVRESASYEEYYKAQGIVPEGEWDEFIAALKRPLPITFRINGSGKYASFLHERLKVDFMKNLSDAPEGKLSSEGAALVGGGEALIEKMVPPFQLDWYPGGSAWQMSFTRNQLRNDPTLARLHEFIKSANENGALTRQEAVSMVPPLFLDVQPHHKVLDMCAAPGSKTMQMLEAVHGNKPVGEFEPQGFVIANDVESKRCALLTHQTKRCCSPAMLVCNHDAQNFPVLMDPLAEEGADGSKAELRFDRVLADVPCTGDGTLRKNPDIWGKWTSTMGCSMHYLQLKVAVQCARQLVVGGRMVYSTCSLNPVENEAVVAELLRQSKGALQLLPSAHLLPTLRRMPGKTTWKVKDKTGWKASFEPSSEPGKSLVASMFPPDAREDQCAFPLERCMRFLPHHHDTGGFFVAVLEKVDNLPLEMHPRRGVLRQQKKEAAGELADPTDVTPLSEPAEVLDSDRQTPVEPAVEPTATSAPQEDQDSKAVSDCEPKPVPASRGGPGRWPGLDPICPVRCAKLIDSLEQFYGFTPEFCVRTQLVSRAPDDQRPKRLYYVNKGLCRVLEADEKEKLKVISVGVKCFERQDRDDNVPCKYRLSQEGLPLTLPHIRKQIVHVEFSEYCTLLQKRNLPFKHDNTDTALKVFSPKSLEGFNNTAQGCVVLVPNLNGAEDIPSAIASEPADLAVVCWLGNATVNLMVSKAESAQLLERVGLDGRTAGDAICKPVLPVKSTDDLAVNDSNKDAPEEP